MTAQDLKNSILQQAIQGKLVPQNPSDEPASELLKKIAEERQKLIDEGKIKNVPLLPPIEDNEKPFDIPDSWQWVRFNNVLDVRDGTHDTPKYVKSGIPLVTSKNLSSGIIDFETAKFISREDADLINTRSAVNDGDILFAMIGTIGNPVLVRKEKEFCIKNMALLKAIDNSLFDMNYLLYFLHIEQNAMKKNASGGVQAFVSLRFLRNYLLPLPPLAEQKRIVAKLEELMPLIERYDAAEKKISTLDKEFPDKLRKSILQQAIQGKLTEQLSSDGNSRNLLEKIRAEKAKLIAVGKIRKEKPLPPIKDDEKPFDIPDNWQWVRLSEIIYGVGSKSNQILAKEVKKIGKYPAISQGQQFIDGYTDLPDKLIYDVPLIMFGDHTRNVKYIDFPFVISADGTKFLKPILIEPKYFYWWTVLTANLLYNRGYNRHYKLLKLKLIPLPPLAEQKRIVAKLNELLPLCDALSEKIRYY